MVISCDPANLARIKQVAEEYGIAADVLGETGGERVEISIDGQPVISANVKNCAARMKARWRRRCTRSDCAFQGESADG